MQRVIGLDIGSYSIKAVEIVNTFKSYEITNFYENIIPHVEELEQDVVLPACMEQLFKENNLEADRIITAMPGQYISSRIIPFNFSDPRKIETAVMSVVEDAVPFNMDDMIIDHQILGTMDSKTVALVVMTKKYFLRSFLENLKRINIDPKLVDVDSLAFYNLNSYVDAAPGECCGLVDVGHEKTSVCIVQDGVLRMFRSINLGGRYITEFLARDLEADFGEAQRQKHRVSTVLYSGYDGSDLSEQDKLVAERTTLAVNAIVKELGRTFYAFKTWEKSPIVKLFISGGTTRLSNFSDYLESQFEMPVIQQKISESDLKINPDLTKYREIMPQSIAIGMRGAPSLKRHSQINLRQGEFAYVQNYEAVLKGAGAAFRIVAIVLLLLCITYGVKHFFYKKNIDSLQNQYLAEYTTLVPSAKNLYKPGKFKFQNLRNDALKKLQTEIESKRNSVDSFVTSNQASIPLMLLQEVSSLMPKDLPVDIVTFKFEVNNKKRVLTLIGETDSYEDAENIKEAVGKVSSLSNVELKESRQKPGSKKITFRVIGDFREDVEGDS